MRGVSVLVMLVIVSLVFPVASAGFSIHHHFYRNNLRTNSNYGDFYFVQVTDTHINIFGYPYNAEKYFKRVIGKLSSLSNKPSFIILTGDLVEFGSGYFGAMNYREFLKCVKGSRDHLYFDGGRKIYALPGNHDYRYSNSLSNYYRYISGFDRYLIIYRDVVILCLNSGRDVIKNGKLKASGLSNSDIHWIETNLKNFPNYRKIIAMHHPVNVLTKNRDKLINLCKRYNVEAILCGHTHRSRIRDIYGRGYSAPIDCYYAPTLIVETDASFHHGAYRAIDIHNGHVIIERCRYAS